MRSKFGADTKVIITIGGWGSNFTDAASNKTQIALFAKNCADLLTSTKADGLDIDWEHPGGNGDDYLTTPNSQKTGEVEAFPKLLEAIRKAIGTEAHLSIAAPGRIGDMIAYTAETVPLIVAQVDYFNLMTYDLMNRRDNITKHHTDFASSKATVDKYLSLGLPKEKAVLGFAYYAKWFQVDSTKPCTGTGLGCTTVVMENTTTGADLGRSGIITFERANMVASAPPANLSVSTDGSCGATTNGLKCAVDSCCGVSGYCGNTTLFCDVGCQLGYGDCHTKVSLGDSWQKAFEDGKADQKAGGQYYFDKVASLFWTWDTPEFICKKSKGIVEAEGLAGVMAWSLGEDTYDNSHMLALNKEVKAIDLEHAARL